jgi:NAD(P)H-hydrate epimerase
MIDEGGWPLVDAARMQALDRYTIEKLGVSGEVLMESAGRSVVDMLLAQCGDLLAMSGAEVCVVCGAGNNAGDGLVIARQLALLGHPVRCVMLLPTDRLAGDAAAQLSRVRAAGVAIDEGALRLPGRGIVVDAIFGTGLSRDIEGPIADSISTINAWREAWPSCARVVAVDLPSGLDAGSGQPLGCAIEADLTVTIASPKRALALEPGRSLAGQVFVARIGIVDAIPGEPAAEGIDAVRLWSPDVAGRMLPGRPAGGHKGSFGHVLVVAGAEGKTGAAALAARASGRAGAGLVTIACPSGLNDILEVKCTEAMTAPVAQTADRALAEQALPELLALARERDVVAIGPGVGQAAQTRRLMRALAREIEAPLVVDADGLNAMVGDLAALSSRGARATVLTPHPGEAARLLDRPASAINADRIGAARTLAKETGCVVLLKGAASVCAEPGGRAIVNPTGGPLLATGGTGDVLTGVVAAMLAQGLAPLEAAGAAAYLHGEAADRIAREHGASGLLAEQLADALPDAAQALRARALGAEGVEGARATLLPFPGR